MELSHFWGITKLHGEVQRKIVVRGLITPETVFDSKFLYFVLVIRCSFLLAAVKARATAAQATSVVEACEKYEKDNWIIMRHVLDSAKKGL
jgi:hypothetical protein